jgi:membrane protein
MAENTAHDAGEGAKVSIEQASHWSARQWWRIVKAALSAWIDDYAPSMGAALSYYTVFSLAPLLVIVISVAGLIFGADAVRGAIFSQIDGLMGAEAAKGIQDLLVNVSKPSTGILGTVIGLVVLLIGATTVFAELQDALDRIWKAPARVTSSGLVTLLRTRLLSFGMILGISFLLTVSLVAGAAIAALGKWWSGWFEGWEVAARVIDTVVGFSMTTAVFALIYKVMPRVKVSWGDVWVGAAVTALLFTAGRFLISLYIGKTGVASGFGAAGSIVVIFVWVYYSAQIFLVGAEFTWVYAQHFGSRRARAEAPVEDARIEQPKPTSVPERHIAEDPEPVVVAAPPVETESGTEPPRQQRQPTVLAPVLAGAVMGAAVVLIARSLPWRHGRDT